MACSVFPSFLPLPLVYCGTRLTRRSFVYIVFYYIHSQLLDHDHPGTVCGGFLRLLFGEELMGFVLHTPVNFLSVCLGILGPESWQM